MRELARLGGGGSKAVRHLKEAAPRVDKQTLAAMVITHDLPDDFDWGNVNGKNYLSKVVNQGNCGSCYAVAAADMISTRLRIRNKTSQKSSDTPSISAQDILDCSEYNQGCSGGFPYLTQKYGNEFGLRSAKQVPYVGLMQTTAMVHTASATKEWQRTCARSEPSTRVGHYG